MVIAAPWLRTGRIPGLRLAPQTPATQIHPGQLYELIDPTFYRGAVAPGGLGRDNGRIEPSPEESPIIPKRKPPSQRPERQLDDVARGIARQAEDAKAAKSADHARTSSADLQSNSSHKGISKPTNAQPSVPTMKRRKTGGG